MGVQLCPIWPTPVTRIYVYHFMYLCWLCLFYIHGASNRPMIPRAWLHSWHSMQGPCCIGPAMTYRALTPNMASWPHAWPRTVKARQWRIDVRLLYMTWRDAMTGLMAWLSWPHRRGPAMRGPSFPYTEVMGLYRPMVSDSVLKDQKEMIMR